MKVDVVVDVGNTRIKWGRCTEDGVVEITSLPPDDPRPWTEQLKDWKVTQPLNWGVSGVHPARRDRFVEWLRQRGDRAEVLDNYQQLPIVVRVPDPEKVGIDRLLNAVAAKIGAGRFDSIIIVDAGTAVTVDLVDQDGAFRGGAILPGFHLMTQSLHDYTALLPLVDVRESNPRLPGNNTESAIEAGVFWAVTGGVRALIRQLTARSGSHRGPEIFITGGNAELLLPVLEKEVRHYPQLTLEGIRLAIEAQP
jgi:type III pantothenate kinase